ncbi:MAG: SDR family oxidoreductase [Planctomycetes bacterium]|nr:SDR family oxidoreductase [Planctomycetota bacterium]
MDSSEFTDQVAIITGAASGMGLLAARRLLAAGAAVLLVDANQEAVTAAVAGCAEAGGRAVAVVADVRRYDQVEQAAAQALQRFGRIDLLLNVAGGAETRVLGLPLPFHELPVEAIDWGLDVNLKGPVYFSRAVLPAMIARKRGVIINLGSVTGMEGAAGAACYSAAKSGLIGFTKSLALCGAPHGVRACCVTPGPVLTRPGMAAMKTRLGRAAEPQEVVDLILFLCSERAAFITGSNHVIDGGRLCGGPD